MRCSSQYIVVESARQLVGGEHPEASWAGINRVPSLISTPIREDPIAVTVERDDPGFAAYDQ